MNFDHDDEGDHKVSIYSVVVCFIVLTSLAVGVLVFEWGLNELF